MALAIEALLYDGTRPATAEPGMWYVRIKPYNPRSGHLLRSLTLSKHGLRIKEQQGWKRLKNPSQELLRDLFHYRNEPGDEHAALAFDVCTYEEAKQEERREREAKIKKQEVRADVEHAGVLTTADLPSSGKSRAELRREANQRKAAERQADREAKEARRSASRSPQRDAEESAEREATRDRILREQSAAEKELADLDEEDRLREEQARRQANATPETVDEDPDTRAGEGSGSVIDPDDDDPLGLDR